MITLIYRAESVGPVCNRVMQQSPETIRIVRDDAITKKIDVGVLWGSTCNVEAKQLLNSPESVRVAKNKIETRKALEEICPKTWFRAQDIKTPCVIRPASHYAGHRFYVCRNETQIRQVILRCRNKWYATELVDKKSEYRVFICQGYVVAVSERSHPDPKAIAWNLAKGGRLVNVRYKSWPVEVCKVAIKGAEKLGLDWCAIDIATDQQGTPLIFEANTAPGLRNPFTISQIAKVFGWIADHNAPKKTAKGDKWRSMLHPALKH